MTRLRSLSRLLSLSVSKPAVPVFIIAMIVEAVALFVDLRPNASPFVPDRWVVYARMILLINVLTTGLALASRQNMVRVLFFALKIHLIVFVGLPYGPNMPIEMFLTSALLVEVAFMLPILLSVAMALLNISAIVYTQYGVNVWNHSIPDSTAANSLLSAVTLVGILTVAIVSNHTIRRYQEEHRQLEIISEAGTQLARVNLNLQSYSSEVEQQAAYQERARITRELHDTIGYAMTNQIMLMEVARRLVNENDSKDELTSIIDQSRLKAHEGLNEARSALHTLRSIRTHEKGAIERIRTLIEAFDHTEVQVVLDTKNVGNNDIRGDMNYIVYRVVQEGITNAIRHGHADRIDVSLWQSERELIITVTDNGAGAKEINAGVGFSGIQERIADRGGALTMRNRNNGFQLDVRIPLVVRSS